MKSSTSILLVLFSLSAFLLYNGVQGEEELSPGDRIIGGLDLSRPHEFPYIVSLENTTLDHWCGGSIIADQYILTAGHCVMSDDVHFRDFPHHIIAGVDDVNSKESTRVLVDVEKIYVSEKYNHSWWAERKMAHDDWALLKLKTKLNVVNNPAMKIVNLPEKVNGEYKTYLSEVGILAGYGYDYIVVVNNTESGISTGVLHKNHVKVLKNSECSFYDKNGYKVYDTQICARFTDEKGGHKYHGPCAGDSGSPLVIDNTVIAIVGLSPMGCDERTAPSVYTRISSFVDAIKNAMNGNTKGLRVGTAP